MMKIVKFLPLFLSVVFIAATFSSSAMAQSTTQVVTPSGAAAPTGTVTTTVQSPGATTTVQAPVNTITRIVTTSTPSTITRSSTGEKIEMDSDGSVYSVYPDGARVAAHDGMHTLASGTTITVKDGKRIP